MNQKLRNSANLTMVSLVLLALANELITNLTHEILGVIFCGIILGHNLLNSAWYKSFLKRSMSVKNTLNLFLNASLMLSLITIVVTGVMTSEDLFDFLWFQSTPFLQGLHVSSAYWFTIFLGMHLGFNWARFTKSVNANFSNTYFRYLRFLLALLIVALGIYASFERGVGDKLFMRAEFDYWNFKKDVVGFFVYTLSIMGMYAILTSYFLKFIKIKKRSFNLKFALETAK